MISPPVPPGRNWLIKHPDEEQTGQARKTQANPLNLQQNVPAKGCSNFHDHVCQDAQRNPAILSVSDRLDHLRAPVGIVIDPVKHREVTLTWKSVTRIFFMSPKRSFHIWTDWRIVSAVLFAFIFQTNKQFVGRSGTSFSKSTLPVKGG